jgi:hypothetical protein
MAKRTRRQAFQQFWEDVQRPQQAGQSLWERWQRWLDEELPSELTSEQAPPRTLPAKRPRGRAPILTDDEVNRLRAAYASIRAESRNQKRAFDKLRKLLPEDKRKIGDTTLRDCIAPPTARK